MMALLLARKFLNFNNVRYCTTKSQVVKDVYKFWENKFVADNVLEPDASIKNIIAHVIGINQPYMVRKQFKRVLSENEVNEIDKLCQLRLKRIPVQYIIGEWQFRELTLKQKAPTFIPRPETEQLIDIVLSHCKEIEGDSIDLLEVGCGSGAIVLSLLKENSKIKATAIDISEDACNLTRLNAEFNDIDTNRVRILHSELTKDNLLNEVNETFDIIVSNAPYVPKEDLNQLSPEVLYEDSRALDGGPDGLRIIILVLQLASRKLRSGGRLFLEFDPRHPHLIDEYLNNSPQLKLCYQYTYQDLCNKERFCQIIKQ